MRPEVHDLILRQLAEHRIMMLATNRSDGWPQATTVSYINDGLLLYCFIARDGQKFANLLRDPRLSIAIASDSSKPGEIKGLSLAGKGAFIEDASEYQRVHALLIKKFPEYADFPIPNPESAPLLRIVPEIISVLDYSKGFGYSNLIAVTPGDLEDYPQPQMNSVSPNRVVPAVRPAGWSAFARFTPSYVRGHRQ